MPDFWETGLDEHISRKIGLYFPGTGIDRVGGNFWIENSITLCGNEAVETIFFMGFTAEYMPQGDVGHLVIGHRKF
jgi:hypothetical protein